MFLWKKLRLLGLFSGDKRDHNDVRMIKITIKANEIQMFACFSEKHNIQK